jgi:uncharacterized protein
LIYFDTSALVKFIRPGVETTALRSWRATLDEDVELVTSELARLELTRALRRAGVDHTRVGYYVNQALRGLFLIDLTSTVLARAVAYQVAKLGSLDAIHLASADPFRADLTDLVTYDRELAGAAVDLGFPVTTPLPSSVG